MTKATFFLLLASFLLITARTEAQQRGKVPVIGVLEPGPPPTQGVSLSACNNGFRQGLRDIGYMEGQNIRVEYRFASGQSQKFPDLLNQLLRLKPDLIWTHSTPAALAAKAATGAVPIVIGVGSALVEQGLVANLARPGGNITGVELRDLELTGKRLELLKQTVPKVSRVAVLVDPKNPFHADVPKNIRSEARAFQIELQRVEAAGPESFDHAFVAISEQRAHALMITEHAMFARHRSRIFELAMSQRLPTISGGPHFAEGGSLLSYGVHPRDACHRSAVLVDKILKGSNAGELPVERPSKFEFLVNLKTASAIGITVPPHVLAQADRVIK